MTAVQRRRRALVICSGLLVVVIAAAIAFPRSGTGAPPGGPIAQPTLGAADSGTVMLGAVTSGGAAGEVWGMRELPLDTPRPEVGGNLLDFGPTSSNRQLAFERYTDANGWQIAQTPRDVNGNPWRGVNANPAAARVLGHGGGFVIGRDDTKPAGQRATLVVRDPGSSARFTQIPAPSNAVMFPAGVPAGQPAEHLATQDGLGNVAMTGWEDATDTHVVIAPQGRDAADGILHWDGSNWTREPVELPEIGRAHV